jgi:hypothetical protein
MKVISSMLCAATVLVCSYLSAQANTVLIHDTFSSATSTALNGSTPTVTVNGAKWVAPTSLTYNSGTLTIPASTTAESSTIDLGSGYFSSHPGVYTLSMTLTIPTGTSTSWVGLGFFSTNATGSNPNAQSSSPMIMLRQNGGSIVYANSANGGTAVTAASTSITNSGTAVTLTLVLDTSKTNWTFDAYIGSTQIDLNGSSTGSTYTYSTNPTSIEYVGLGSSIGSSAFAATISDFSLVTSVPEPKICALLLLGLLLTWKGFGRRNHRIS